MLCIDFMGCHWLQRGYTDLSYYVLEEFNCIVFPTIALRVWPTNAPLERNIVFYSCYLPTLCTLV